MQTSAPVFKIGPTQIQLLDAIQQSIYLKKKLVACTLEFFIGTKVRVKDDFYTIESVLGSGLIGTVYKVVDLESKKTFALKHSRANFAFYQQSLQIELDTSQLIARELKHLKVIPIHLTTNRFMLKEYCELPTLQSIIFNNSVNSSHISELEKVLRDCLTIFEKHHILVDLSPKNIVWDGLNWFLIDCGPKLHRSPFEEVIKDGTWKTYLDYTQTRVQTVDSQPSALSLSSENTEPLGQKMAFIKDWWDWFPLSENFDEEFYFAQIDSSLIENEFLIIAEKNESGYQLYDVQNNQIHPLVRLIAIEKWKLNYGKDNVPSDLKFEWDELSIDPNSEPLNWDNLVSEVSNFGLGRTLRSLFQKEVKLTQPTLKINDYKHWKDLFNNLDDHKVTDIYCHSPMKIELLSEVKKLNKKNIQIPLNHDFTYANIDLFGSNQSKKAILILPGFRAPNEAAHALINDLVRKNVHDQFIVAQLGVKNTEDQLLVTAGRWETIILWDLIEYCFHSLELDELEIIAASHGAIAAWIVSCMHPSVKKIVLDSPLLNPLKLLSEIAKFRQENQDIFIDSLKENGLPFINYQMFNNPPSSLKVINLCPEKDLFIDLCGKLPIGEQITYQGGHAATLRHDSAEKGIPSICIDSIADFLN